MRTTQAVCLRVQMGCRRHGAHQILSTAKPTAGHQVRDHSSAIKSGKTQLSCNDNAFYRRRFCEREHQEAEAIGVFGSGRIWG